MALSTAPGFLIEELTGLQRSVALTGWALPRQNVAFGRRNRLKKRYYAGNPQATLQVLGPELEPTTIEGMWSDRWLPGQTFVAGFDQPDTAEALVAIFEELSNAAQPLRVQWGTVVRYGVISEFTPTWVRPEDCAFSIEFEWSGEEPQRVRAGPIAVEDDAVRAAMVRLDDESVVVPSTVIDGVIQVGDRVSTPDETLAEVRRGVVGVLFAVADLREAVDAELQPVTDALTTISVVRTTIGELLVQLIDVPYTVSTVYDSVVDVLDAESWRRTMGYRAGELREVSLVKAAELDRIPRPKTQVVVTIQAGQTLRDVALAYYGDSDGWERIADANLLVSSQVAPGTLVVVPLPQGA